MINKLQKKTRLELYSGMCDRETGKMAFLRQIAERVTISIESNNRPPLKLDYNSAEYKRRSPAAQCRRASFHAIAMLYCRVCKLERQLPLL